MSWSARPALIWRNVVRLFQSDTAHLKTAQALRDAEERTALIVENALDAVVTIDTAGLITSWNPQAERLFGWPSEEALGRRLSDTIIPPAYRDAHERGLAHFRATGEGPVLGQRIELTALRRNGTEFPVELAITPVQIGGATAFSAFLRDISDRKGAEAALAQSAASFRLLFESNPLPMWVYDVSTMDFLEVNPAAVAHYGYSRDEFLRMRITDIRPVEGVPRLTQVVAGFTVGTPREAGIWAHRLKDGRIRAVDIRAHSIQFADRQAALVVANDVTELQQAQAALQKSTERLRLLHQIDQAMIAEQAPEAIAAAAVQPLRDLLGVPRTIVNLFDLPAGEVEWLAAAGRHQVRTGPGVRFSMALMGNVEGLRRGEPQIVDVDALPPSRHAEALLASGVHMYMVVPMIAAGELIGGLSFGGARRELSSEQISIAREVAAQLAIAITQVRLRERVRQQTEELEQRVQDRTLALSATNAQLQEEIAERQQAEAAADRANHAKSEFLSRMSHELRTPLNGILGFAQLLEREELNPEQGESVEHIVKGGRHLLTLINEVLDIARIESGGLSISTEPVSTCEVFGSALDLVRPQASARAVALPAGLSADRYVLADRQRLQQVLLNLLSNAVKYTGQSGSVTISCTEPEPGRVRLGVSDTGPGIAPAMLERLYTPFDRLGADHSGIEGTGLGLALSKRLAEAMNGRLLVESRVGEGTTFTVELPAAEAPPERIADPQDAGAETDASRVRGTVLYIEDNLANLRLVERIVRHRPGITLLPAMQGSRGLELARGHRPDLIVLDLHLPDLPGTEVLTRLRHDPTTRHIPVVILSADATGAQIRALLAQGAHAYLTKPIEVAALLGVFDRLLNGTGG